MRTTWTDAAMMVVGAVAVVFVATRVLRPTPRGKVERTR